jgi:hypothetical protein
LAWAGAPNDEADAALIGRGSTHDLKASGELIQRSMRHGG